MAAWIGSGTGHFDFTSFRLARDSQAVWVVLRARFVGSGDRLAVGYIECVCAPLHLARASSRLTLPKQWVELLGGCRGVPFAIVSIFCRLLLSVAKFLANFCRNSPRTARGIKINQNYFLVVKIERYLIFWMPIMTMTSMSMIFCHSSVSSDETVPSRIVPRMSMAMASSMSTIFSTCWASSAKTADQFKNGLNSQRPRLMARSLFFLSLFLS